MVLNFIDRLMDIVTDTKFITIGSDVCWLDKYVQPHHCNRKMKATLKDNLLQSIVFVTVATHI